MMNSRLGHSPLVSVVVPIFNAEKFIDEAIKSVFAQTYCDWELLLVDDGSTDRSAQIALHYAKQYPGQVRYLQHGGHENRGQSASRNLGIRYAKGEYIAFLDSDDVWLPHKLESEVAILNSQPEAAMVYGSAEQWHSWTGNPEDVRRDHVPAHNLPLNTLIRPPVLFLSFLLRKTDVPSPSTVVVRRDAIAQVGGFEEEFRGVYEDQVFYAKVLLNKTAFVAGECWVKYRQHPNSICAVAMKTGQWHSEPLMFLNWLEHYLSTHGFKHTAIWNILQKELFPYRHPKLYDLLGNAERLSNRTTQPLNTVRRLMLRKSVGSIKANPNPVRVSDGSWLEVTGVTTLSWVSRGATAVEVHVGAPDGPLFSRTGPLGCATTGRWVTNGMVFYLQDVSEGFLLTSKNTLGTVIVTVTRNKPN